MTWVDLMLATATEPTSRPSSSTASARHERDDAERPGLQLDLGHHPVLQDAGDDAAHPVAGGLVGDAAHGCGRGDLLGDGGEVGACDDHPSSGVPVAGQPAGVDHSADRVVGDPQQGGGL